MCACVLHIENTEQQQNDWDLFSVYLLKIMLEYFFFVEKMRPNEKKHNIYK